jgi:hypothetical protein
MMDHASKSLSYPTAAKRNVQSLDNWMQANSSIARNEVAYIQEKDDLANLSKFTDNAITRVESLVEDCAMYLEIGLRKVFT